MNIALWMVQGILALMFAMAGVMKSTQSKEQLAPKVPWVVDFSLPTIRLIGVSELLAAIGLVAPMLSGVLPVLTPAAAIGLCAIMVLAIGYHLRKGEMKAVVFNTVLLCLAAFVAYGRL